MRYELRAFGRYSKMQKLLDCLKRKYRRLMAIQVTYNEDYYDKEVLNELMDAILDDMREILFVDIPAAPAIVYLHRTIESFSEAECFRRFRIRKPDLSRILRLLEIPNQLKSENRIVYNGQELFLFTLNRFTHCGCIADMISIYGREITIWYVGFHLMISFLMETWSFLLTDNLEFWKPYLVPMSKKIEWKYLQCGGVMPPNTIFRVCAFIDCTYIYSCRPGGGPRFPGVGSARNDNLIQFTFYNGYKKGHGLKYQTVELPNGMACHVYGPKPLRKSDVEILQQSNIHNKWQELHADVPADDWKVLYGDGIYPIHQFILSGVPDFQKIRIANELVYGTTAIMFPFLKWRGHLHLRKHKDNPLLYMIGTLFRNISYCLYGGVAASRFYTDDDALEEMCEVHIENYLIRRN